MADKNDDDDKGGVGPDDKGTGSDAAAAGGDGSGVKGPGTREPVDHGGSDIRPVSIIDEMKKSYLDYAMSVIVSRALPDVRDGMKPVHRRILYGMHEMGLAHNKPYRKSAKVVGEVMGSYHPHGDGAIYDALVRLAQDFSMRLQLVDGQGNFGSVDGDPPAAMRYTECRLQKVSHYLLDDLANNTVDYQDNYDASESEPKVLPAKFPNLLVNGAGGIAVGMATNIPPHNLVEVINAVMAYLDDPTIDLDALCEIVPGPDFPTGAMILGRGGILSAYHKSRGSIMMRARASFEEIRKDRHAIIVTEIPYQVNKQNLIDKIADMVRNKRIEGIANIWDESSREGMRIVIQLKRDAVGDVVLNQLYRFSQLQTAFSANMIALNGGRPESLNLLDMIQAFAAFREEVVGRRIKHLLKKSRERAHVLVGLAIAVANIDEIIHLIRHAPSPSVAREQLLEREWPARDVAPLVELIADPRHKVSSEGTYKLSDEQTRAILELRLARLTGLGRDEIGDELKGLGDKIKEYLEILSSRMRIVDIVKNELVEVQQMFGTPRKTEIIDVDFEVDDEDLIQREDVVVTVSHKGYIKRVPLSTYRAQRRGGKGRSGMSTRDEDFVSQIFITSTHTPVLFFSSRGMVYRMKVWRLPAATPQSLGKALINLLPLEQEEVITTILLLPEDTETWSALELMFATRSGNVRRNSLTDFESINRNGKIAMKLNEGDQLAGVAICSTADDVLLTTANGQCIRFPAEDVRVFKGRDSSGVRGIRLAEGNEVISMAILHHVEATPAERAVYVKQANAIRRATGDDVAEEGVDGTEGTDAGVGGGDGSEPGAETVPGAGTEPDAVPELEGTAELTPERYAELGASEQIVLAISEQGYGKRSSSYDYRTSGRGGKGIVAMVVNERNGKLVGAFPVEDSDQIMLVTNAGKLIRTPVHDVRIAARNTQGVRLFRTADDEKVVSVEHIPDDGSSDDEGGAEDGNGGGEGGNGGAGDATGISEDRGVDGAGTAVETGDAGDVSADGDDSSSGADGESGKDSKG